MIKVIGSVTLAMGGALVTTPQQSTRMLGLPYSPRWTRLLGLADALLGVALLSGRQTRQWMHVRAAANVGLAALYAVQLQSSAPNARRTGIGLVMMLFITVTDGAFARALPKHESNRE